MDRYESTVVNETRTVALPAEAGLDVFISYARYDPHMTQQGLNDLGLDQIDATSVQVMDSVVHIADIQRRDGLCATPCAAGVFSAFHIGADATAQR